MLRVGFLRKRLCQPDRLYGRIEELLLPQIGDAAATGMLDDDVRLVPNDLIRFSRCRHRRHPSP